MRPRLLREQAGMSRPGLAKAGNVPTGSIRNWEQGRREPMLSAAAAVATALSVSLDVLAGLSPLDPTPAVQPPATTPDKMPEATPAKAGRPRRMKPA